MGWLFTKRRMAAELGADWQSKILAAFSRDAYQRPRLDRCIKAIGLDGMPLAAKLQYPDMHSAIEADLRQLKLLFQLYERYDSAISTADIYDELSERFWKSLIITARL